MFGNNITKFETKREGLTIKGKIYGKGSTKRPVVILSHGFMGNMNTCKKYAKALSALGYVCFIYDFNGGGIFSSSEGKTTEMSALTEVKDLKAVINYVKVQDFVDANDISLLGCSQGGFVSAIVSKQLKDEIKNLILFYPALCIPDDARKGSMIMAKFDPDNVPETFKCGPMKLGRCYVDDVKEMDVFEEISGYNGKVFLIHGTKDEIVNIDYSRRAKDLYSEIVYHEIQGGAHGFRGEHDKQAIRHLTDFMAR